METKFDFAKEKAEKMAAMIIGYMLMGATKMYEKQNIDEVKFFVDITEKANGKKIYTANVLYNTIQTEWNEIPCNDKRFIAVSNFFYAVNKYLAKYEF